MSDIPTVTFQILGPNEGVAEGSHKGLWFKVHSDPAPARNLLVGVKVCASHGEVQQSGTVMILKHESHSADFFTRQWKVNLMSGWRLNLLIRSPN